MPLDQSLMHGIMCDMITVCHNDSTPEDTSRVHGKISTLTTDTMPSIGFIGAYNELLILLMGTYSRAQLHALTPYTTSFPYFVLDGATSTRILRPREAHLKWARGGQLRNPHKPPQITSNWRP